MKLAVFDFDATLMDGETLDFIAQDLGIKDTMSSITELAMQGKIDFFESLQQRVSLLQGYSYTKACTICANLPKMPGAKEIILELKQRDYLCVCFSGGFDIATIPMAKELNLDGVFSNTLHQKDGILSGKLGGEMMFEDSKGIMLQKLQKLLKISQENTLVVGDGANDISMFKFAKTRIAFCSKPILKEYANIIIEQKDLRTILRHL